MYGEEEFLINWAVSMIKKAYISPSFESIDYIVLDEDNLSAEKIIESSDTFSMFSKKRVVWVKI